MIFYRENLPACSSDLRLRQIEEQISKTLADGLKNQPGCLNHSSSIAISMLVHMT